MKSLNSYINEGFAERFSEKDEAYIKSVCKTYKIPTTGRYDSGVRVSSESIEIGIWDGCGTILYNVRYVNDKNGNTIKHFEGLTQGSSSDERDFEKRLEGLRTVENFVKAIDTIRRSLGIDKDPLKSLFK